MPRAIVLIIDGLGCKHIGPYGNTSIETAGFNQLASESLLFENVFAPFAEVEKSFEALMTGRSAIRQEVDALKDSDLLAWLETRKVTTKLFTDDADLVDYRLSAKFAEQTNLEPAVGVKLANEWDETHTAKFFAQAISAIGQLQENELLWLHTRGLGNPWDAPYEYRNQFVGEEDPDPSGSAQVPSLLLEPDHDPDTVHEIQCSYAGQVSLIDQCVDVLLTALRESPNEDTMLIVSSLRGFPLGEHLRIGFKEPSLRHELLHVPCLVRYPNGRYAMRRDARLSGFSQLTDVLVNWFAASEYVVDDSAENFSVSQSTNDWLLRTPAWQIRFQVPLEEELTAELYLKPDDQNEVNNVSDRRTDVVEAARVHLKAILEQPEESLELPEILIDPPT